MPTRLEAVASAPVSLLVRDVARLAPTLDLRAWWLREALAADQGAPCPPLSGRATADVVIVGGGFTGLWTAWNLVERAPGIRVMILEADIVGGGASGRNGGFMAGWWPTLPGLVASFGEAGGLAAALAVEPAPAAIEAWCADHAVDAWVRPGGMLMAASSAVQDGAWGGLLDLARRLGVADRLVPLSRAEVQARCASPALRGGVLSPHDRSVQPARLARGLRRVLLERGVAIHEGTRVRRVLPRGRSAVAPGAGRDAGRVAGRVAGRDAGIVVETDGGSVEAGHVVLALNAWAAGWPGFGSRVVTWSSYMVLTEPIPDRLAELGWTGGEAITDARFTNHYFRTTADGRIAFGGGGGRAGYGGRLGRWVTHDLGSVRLAARGFRRIFPMLRDIALVEAWGGPIDIAPNHLPAFGTLPPGRVHWGHGYSGEGVGPSWLGGRILAALALDRVDDPVLALPLVGSRPRRFPPEPFRFVGARVIREAIVAKESADDRGRPVSPVLRGLVRLPRAMGYQLGPE